MLFKMATGNLYFRITEKDRDDEISQLAEMLNSLASEMQETIAGLGYITPLYTYQNVIQFSIVLDMDGRIKNFSESVPKMLGYKPEELITMYFPQLLVPDSAAMAEYIKKQVNIDQDYNNTIQLLLLTKKQQIIPAFFTISRHLYSDTILVSYITTILEELLNDIAPVKPLSSKKSESAIIQEVYDYIRQHLDDPLPSAKYLANLYGTNEHTLKISFRSFFKTTIYQFYNDERLKKAHYLVQQSNLPLKEIPFICGFNDYHNFLKAFKKRYNYTPRDLKRFGDDEDA